MPRKLIVIIIFGSLALGLFIQYQARVTKRGFCDYRVYYEAGRDILTGQNIYQQDSEAITPFKYSPFFAVFMAPFSMVDKRTSASLFFILNLICLFFILKVSRRLIFFKDIGRKKEYLVFLIVFVLSFRAILHCLQSGQVGLLIVLSILLGLLFISRNKQVQGSFLIGFAVMIKYMPFLFGLHFLIKKKYKVCLFFALALIVYCLLPGIFFGAKTNFHYLKDWFPYITSTSLDSGSLVDSKNYSLWTLIRRIIPGISANWAIISIILVFGVVVVLFSIKGKGRQSNPQMNEFYDCIDYGMVFLAMALFNPNAWLHNFVVVIFPYMIVMYYLFICNFKDKIVLALLALSFIFFSLVSESLVGDRMQNMLECCSVVTWGTLLLFAALFKIKFYSNSITIGGLRNG